jgi:hypothetical protein
MDHDAGLCVIKDNAYDNVEFNREPGLESGYNNRHQAGWVDFLGFAQILNKDALMAAGYQLERNGDLAAAYLESCVLERRVQDGAFHWLIRGRSIV